MFACLIDICTNCNMKNCTCYRHIDNNETCLNKSPKKNSKRKGKPISKTHESKGNENKNVNSSDPKIETYFGLEKTGLKLSHLNIRNILPKIDEIKQFTNQGHNTHTFGLCETFLTETVTNDMINIEGFTLERKDRCETRDKLGGGLAIYISNSLNHKGRKDLEVSNMENVWL